MDVMFIFVSFLVFAILCAPILFFLFVLIYERWFESQEDKDFVKYLKENDVSDIVISSTGGMTKRRKK